MSDYVSARFRQAVVTRAQSVYEYCRCQLKFSHDPFDVEHIVPQAKGGLTELSNLALSCHGCNLAKSDRTQAEDAVSGSVVAFFHPRYDVWQEHFLWANNFTRLVGRTAKGRVTIEALQMNREGLVNQRRALCRYGEHPPEMG